VPVIEAEIREEKKTVARGRGRGERGKKTKEGKRKPFTAI
jgi:hypothetical protein